MTMSRGVSVGISTFSTQRVKHSPFTGSSRSRYASIRSWRSGAMKVQVLMLCYFRDAHCGATAHHGGRRMNPF